MDAKSAVGAKKKNFINGIKPRNQFTMNVLKHAVGYKAMNKKKVSITMTKIQSNVNRAGRYSPRLRSIYRDCKEGQDY